MVTHGIIMISKTTKLIDNLRCRARPNSGPTKQTGRSQTHTRARTHAHTNTHVRVKGDWSSCGMRATSFKKQTTTIGKQTTASIFFQTVLKGSVVLQPLWQTDRHPAVAVFILPSLTLHSSLCRRNCRRLNVSQLSWQGGKISPACTDAVSRHINIFLFCHLL